ncbi:glycosyltransferase family 2 protein [Sistotremastrum niveocremeum HHB9708]|uniref:chitin synthase n=1 Tax=Sistotremastrum niveocremeum HHB9708 TaxID=1314777 RepID=A0A164ZUV1_9AGAM|nr:glycosyltransferase family 2 protein [Sistotremastrum niveocremeum HHB9708]
MAQIREAITSGELTDLVSSGASATIYPTDEHILQTLQTRFRADLPYSRIASTNYVVVNPYKALANVDDATANEYEERCYKDTSLPTTADAPKALQPHLYELAARVYLLMRRRNESQSIVFQGITGSAKSSSAELLTNQILRLSTRTRRELRVAEQIRAIGPLLDSFGNAKTRINPNASRHSRYFELHFNERGRIASAKVLAFGLDKSRVLKLSTEERTFHVFYQLLAGASPDEREALNIEDASEYALLASSGCYRLPSGPFSDDSIAMADLRASMRILGFKPKHISSIFSILVAILELGNLHFVDSGSREESARVTNTVLLDHIARLLGVASDDLEQALTNKTNYVRKELYTVLLDAEQSRTQRDSLVQALYAILFAYVVEAVNHKLSAEEVPATQIILLDTPGFQSRAPGPNTSISATGAPPLISAHGQSPFDEFVINFSNELVHSYVSRNTFEDSVGLNSFLTADGIELPTISTMDNSGCVELLRGTMVPEKIQKKPEGLLGVIHKACTSFKSGKAAQGDKKDEELLADLVSKFGTHASFITSPGLGNPSQTGMNDKSLFGINHYAGPCAYDASHFIEKDADMLDPAFVTILRQSTESFIAKLVSGPSLAAEVHSKDENTLVQAQVSSRPLRNPSPIKSMNNTLPSASETEGQPQLDPTKCYPITTQVNFTLSSLLTSLDRTQVWTVSCIRPNDSGSPNSFDKRRVKAQIRSLLLPDLVAKRRTEFLVDYDHEAFCDRYVPTMQGETVDRIRQCAQAHGWKDGVDYVQGHSSVWLTYAAWKMIEDGLRAEEQARKPSVEDEDALPTGGSMEDVSPGIRTGNAGYADSQDNLLLTRTGTHGSRYQEPNTGYGPSSLNTPMLGEPGGDDGSAWGSEWDKKNPNLSSPSGKDNSQESGGLIQKTVAPGEVEEVPTSRGRRNWVRFVWFMTWWIPSFLLSWIGRMKRPDIRMAWREKVTICMLIFLMCGIVIFYIIFFGRLLCPNFDKAWLPTEVAQHQGTNDFWVSVHGQVYDLSNFWKGQHSDIPAQPVSQGSMIQFAGQDLTDYFPPPLTLACPGLVNDTTITVIPQNFTIIDPTAIHLSGPMQPFQQSKLADPSWYTDTFLPAMKQFHKGPLVWSSKDIHEEADSGDRTWAVWDNGLYDLTDYFWSITQNPSSKDQFSYLDDSITSLFQQQPGQDISLAVNTALSLMDPLDAAKQNACLKNVFQVGQTDFRKTPRCLVQNYLLLTFSIIIMTTIGAKFLAALQLTGKRSPEMLDKFVICQVPCYTEGEESLRRTIDSLAALRYDDKRKLLFIICDGNIIGSGNDRPTPRIVLDILGVDPKLDPEPVLFKSVGEGSKQLNYGKVYSGLYEFEGHVVPYLVVVKVGKPSERSRPGNRGKRDSQILLMHYLNRVHFDAPMSPLELEIYHQMRNVIGIDPAFYEYIFTIDADTSVTPDSLNRLVACTADDSKIIGICGETRLDNEEGSWWTMIQVYEYYISHHMAKAFESLFGSVTCLPGCFSMYRIRTADKGRPIIISNRVIDEYSENNVDTLHKKNLLALGEDRYLTTLLMKNFPTFKTKFTPDAVAHTVAPDRWSVLLSQRRRWINSTIHNLCELVFLPELCGFCCFSMRFVVFLDLLGTIILPATTVYLVYLIIVVSTGKAAIPILSLAMIAAVYGFQAIIFILKREFMLVGWMVIYILAYPIYSFFLPIYSFWCMDDFSWGNTRLVIGEGANKKVIMNDDEKYDDSMIPLKKFSEYEAEAWEQGSHHTEEETHSVSPSGHSRPPQIPEMPIPRTDSPHSYNPASQSGDFYRDTNLTFNNSSNPNLRIPKKPSMQTMSQHGSAPPQLGPLPYSAGPGSHAGSEYGGMMPPQMGFVGTPSMYGMGGMGMMPQGPRNSVMTNLNMFGASGSIAGSGFTPPNPNFGMPQNRMSTFSLATSVNPFTGSPSLNPNPSDEELLNVLKGYLSTQDLMTVTKKTAREAVMSRFPKADLSSRKDFLNTSIDQILATE